MPEVKVLPEVFIGTSTVTAETESIFNDLVLKDIDVTDNGTTVTYATSRFSYTYDKSTVIAADRTVKAMCTIITVSLSVL